MSDERPVIVTGAGGFIGRHLVAHLLETGRQVVATDIHVEGLEALRDRPGLEIRRLDVRSDEMLDLMDGAGLVFHLAAAHLEVGADETHYRSVNVEALERICQTAAQGSVKRLIHCSTVGVYGPLSETPADEESPCNPEIAYERTKLEGEAVVARHVRESGLDAVMIRPSWVYGPGCPRTRKLIQTIARKRFFFVGDSKNQRHPLYIDDLLHAFDLAATAECDPGEVFLIAGPASVTTRELAATIIDILDMDYRPPTLPSALVAAGCYLLESGFSLAGREPPFSRRSLKFFTENSAFSTAKARRVLSYEPKIGLETGLAKTIAVLRERGVLESARGAAAGA